jgi:hypothetical protein
MKLKNKLRLLAWLPMLVLLQACYSFTGANLDPNIKSISVQNFYNDSGGGPANMMQLFTERLRDYYQRNTSLSLVDNAGDLQLEGAIVGWNLAPVAPTASGNENIGDLSSLQRLTITVRVSYVNTYDETQSFDRNFSFYSDYNPNTTTLQAEEARLIDEIFESIVFDIFNATVANW